MFVSNMDVLNKLLMIIFLFLAQLELYKEHTSQKYVQTEPGPSGVPESCKKCLILLSSFNFLESLLIVDRLSYW